MKPKFIKGVTIVTVLMLFFSANLFAQRKVKSTGIGLRGTHWKMTNDQTRIIVSDYGSRSSVETGSGGVWLFLLSRMNHNTWFELSFGAVGKVQEESYYYTNSDVDVFAVTPILLGLRVELIAPESQTSLKPYLSLGGGPYWSSNISVKERTYEDEVKVETKLKRGGYLGGGANFLLSDWFALNFDMKYHFINFNKKDVNSGFEYGFGVSFMWGNFR